MALHRADLRSDDVEQRAGFAVSRPLRAIADVAIQGVLSRDLVAQAQNEGRQRGLITAQGITELRRRETPAEWFNKLLDVNR